MVGIKKRYELYAYEPRDLFAVAGCFVDAYANCGKRAIGLADTYQAFRFNSDAAHDENRWRASGSR